MAKSKSCPQQLSVLDSDLGLIDFKFIFARSPLQEQDGLQGASVSSYHDGS